MYDRLAVAGMSAVLAIGVLALGASLMRTSDPAAAPCPADFDESEAMDTSASGLSQAQRAWGISGGAPGSVRPGVVAAYASDPSNAPLSVITIDPETGRQCRLVRFASHHLVQGPGYTSLDWSPAGDALAIGVHDEDPGGGGSHGQVLIWTPDRLFRIWSADAIPGLEWAPDGRSVAVWKAGWGDPDPAPETRVIHADGSPDRTYGIRPLIDDLAWSPDGSRWLVVQGTFTFRPSAASIVNLADGRVAPIALGISHYNAIGWIDDGRVLVREVPETGMRYLDVPVAAPADVSILPIPIGEPSYQIALSPSGRRVAYSTANGLEILDLEDVSTSAPVRVDVAGATGAGWPSWSPDGEQILFGAAGAYWVVNVDGTGLRQLVTGNIHPFDNPWQPLPLQ